VTPSPDVTVKQPLTAANPEFLKSQFDYNKQVALATNPAIAQSKIDVAGGEAAARFPFEAKLEALRQQGDSVYAFNPQTNQTIQTSRGQAIAQGLTNIVKVGETQIAADKARAMQLGDAQINLSAYRVASQKMDELSGPDIAKVGQLLGDSSFKAHFLGAELPSDWANELMKNNLWTNLSPDAQEAVVGYLAARPAAISMLRAINPGVRLTESQIKTELQNIPDPTVPSNVREGMFNRLQRNLDQAATTIPQIPGVDRPSDIRARVEGQLTNQALAQKQAAQNATNNASGEFTDAKMEHPQGSVFLFNNKWMRVSKVYPDKSFDAEETISYAP
jgi:hypothetical protein